MEKKQILQYLLEILLLLQNKENAFAISPERRLIDKKGDPVFTELLISHKDLEMDPEKNEPYDYSESDDGTFNCRLKKEGPIYRFISADNKPATLDGIDTCLMQDVYSQNKPAFDPSGHPVISIGGRDFVLVIDKEGTKYLFNLVNGFYHVSYHRSYTSEGYKVPVYKAYTIEEVTPNRIKLWATELFLPHNPLPKNNLGMTIFEGRYGSYTTIERIHPSGTRYLIDLDAANYPKDYRELYSGPSNREKLDDNIQIFSCLDRYGQTLIVKITYDSSASPCDLKVLTAEEDIVKYVTNLELNRFDLAQIDLLQKKEIPVELINEYPLQLSFDDLLAFIEASVAGCFVALCLQAYNQLSVNFDRVKVMSLYKDDQRDSWGINDIIGMIQFDAGVVDGSGDQQTQANTHSTDGQPDLDRIVPAQDGDPRFGALDFSDYPAGSQVNTSQPNGELFTFRTDPKTGELVANGGFRNIDLD